MSDMFRRSVLNRLPQIPPTRAPWAESTGTEDDLEELEEDDGDSLGDLAAALPSSSNRFSEDLSPISASTFFAQALEVNPPEFDTTFRVYLTPSRDDKGACLLCHHGAGAGGLSFAALAKELTEQSRGELGVLAFDGRGHGKTISEGGKARDTDLSLPTLLADFEGLIQHIFPDPKEAPPFVLVGHSMGAAPVLAAAPRLQIKGYKVPGVVVLDVVEGTAVESLPLMKSILAQRPKSFRSSIDAIHWHLTSGSIRNDKSARVSVPSFLSPGPNDTATGPQAKQVWRTDLLATEPYWEEWYRGLSSRFLSARCARLLVLAGQERLDRELMVGQMQGKFQLEVMPDVGHYLHEDDPQRLASTLVAFWRRNTQVIVLPPKIGATTGDLSRSVEVKRVGEE